MEFKLIASMMYANYGNLEKEVRELEKGGIDSFHIDIMDNYYVPNFAMVFNDMRYISKETKSPLDVHLMFERPNDTIQVFLDNLRKGDTLYIHPETEYYPSITLEKIMDAGMVPGVALHPDTNTETIVELLPIVKKVLVMCESSTDSDLMYLPNMDKKIEWLLEMKEEMNFRVYLEGICELDKIQKFISMGVDGFVLGKRLLFGRDELYKEVVQKIRE